MKKLRKRKKDSPKKIETLIEEAEAIESSKPYEPPEGTPLFEILEELTEPEDMKVVVCSFHKKGRNSKCFGCKQEAETIDECRISMLEVVSKVPRFNKIDSVWDESFDAPIIIRREKEAFKRASESIGIGLLCNTCHISENCPSHKEDHECGIDWDEGIDKNDSKAIMEFLIGIQLGRVSRSRQMELIDGGMPDQTTSGEMDRLSNLTSMKSDIEADRLSIRIDAKSNSGSEGGLLAKLFGGGNGKTEALPEHDTTLDIESEVIEPIKVNNNDGDRKN